MILFLKGCNHYSQPFQSMFDSCVRPVYGKSSIALVNQLAFTDDLQVSYINHNLSTDSRPPLS